MWLNQLKIAVLEKNITQLDKLINDIPKLESSKDLEEGIYLLKEATSLVENLKDKTSISMKQMKKNIKFLEATETQKAKTLDIKL